MLNVVESVSNVDLKGILHLANWGYVLIAVLLMHCTSIAVSLFLHRNQSHHSIELHPIVSHILRFYLWLSTGIVTKTYVTHHRKHHVLGESHDPHPLISVKCWVPSFRRNQEAKDQEHIKQFGQNTPNDWMERNVYSKHPGVGVSLWLVAEIMVFGPIAAIAMWLTQQWMNCYGNNGSGFGGGGHGKLKIGSKTIGYKNFKLKDTDSSTNIMNLALFDAGEELHNNHHAFPNSAKFSIQPNEFDIGFFYISMLEKVGLAKVKQTMPEHAFTKVMSFSENHSDSNSKSFKTH